MAENCAGVICTADNLLYRDGSEDYSTIWYTVEYNGEQYKFNNKSTIIVKVNGEFREVLMKEAIDNDYDISEDSLARFKC